MGAARVADMAAALLTHSGDALDASARPAPSRRYVCHGLPAHDCEQLTVSLAQISPKLLGRGDPEVRGRMAVWAVAQFSIELVRCVPGVEEGGAPPDAAELGASALGLMADGWVVWSWLTRLWVKNALLPSSEPNLLQPNTPPVTFDSLVPINPSGQLAGIKMLLTLHVPVAGEATAAH